MVKSIAIIPARGGSKRIPFKNIVDFCGYPMIYWTIKAAIKSDVFDRVVVSTDSSEIMTLAKKFGAEVPFLRTLNNNDYSNVSDVIVEELPKFEYYFQEDYDYVYSLMPNCPFRSAQLIKEFHNYFLNKDFDFLLSSTQFLFTNPWWAVIHRTDDNYESIFKDKILSRSQDLENLKSPTGSIWGAKKNEIMIQKTFYGNNYKFYSIDWLSAIDIDDFAELDIAQYFCKKMKEENE